MKISVIIPVHNYAQYLPETIKNVQDQAGQFELEIIAVDDGSTDNSLNVLESIAEQKGSRLRVISIAHAGVSAARNAGIKKADGDAVLFLDADDLIVPEYLSAQSAMLLNTPSADAVISNCLIFDRENHQISMWGLCKSDFALHLCASNIAPIHSFMVRRSLVEDVGLFDESLLAHEDYEYWLRAAVSEKNFVVNNSALALYRKHSQSLSTNREIMGDTELEILHRIDKALEKTMARNGNFPPQGVSAGYIARAASILGKAVALKDVSYEESMKVVRLASISLCKSLKFYIPEAIKNNDTLKLYLCHLRMHARHFEDCGYLADALSAVLGRFTEIAMLPLDAQVLNSLFEATVIPSSVRESLARAFLMKYRAMI